MGDFAVFVGVFDFAALDFEHFLVNACEPFAHVVNIGIVKRHSGEIDLKSGCPVHKRVFVASLCPIFHDLSSPDEF